MADFDVIHRRQMDACDGKLRAGECWTIQLLEPLPAATKKPDIDARIKTVRLVMTVHHTLKAATELDLRDIMDWKRRHRKTPTEWFGLPSALVE